MRFHWLLAVIMIQATLSYPVARKGDTVDTYGTRTIADPYRWMEDLNSPELKRWVDAENSVTVRYLDALPERDALKKRITELYDYARVTMPEFEGRRWFYTRNTGLQRQSVVFRSDALPERDALKKRITELYDYARVTMPEFEGRRWFYTRNTGLQRQSVVFTRETLSGPETVVVDPNQLSPDGSVALSAFDPAPDGQHYVYGQSEGGSDWETLYVREIGSNRQLADVIKFVRFSSVAWTKDGKGFFYGRYPEP